MIPTAPPPALLSGKIRPPSVAGLAAWYGGSGPLWQDAGRTVAAAAGDPVRVIDDRSGLGRHAVAASDSARGQADTDAASGPPSVYLDGLFSQFAVPAGVAFDERDYSAFFSLVWLGGSWSQVIWQPASGTQLYLQDNGIAGCGALLSAAPASTANNAILAVISRPSGFHLRLNGVAVSGAALASAARTGGLIGDWANGTANAQVILSESAIYSRGVTDAEATRIEAYLARGRSFVRRYPTSRDLVAFAGNSITGGQAVSNQNLIFAGRAIRSLPIPFTRYARNAIGGFTTPQLAGVYSATIAPLYDAARAKNVLVFQELTADLYFGASGPDAFAHALSYCQTAHDQGWKVVVIDCLDRQQAGRPADFDTQRASVNSLLAAEFTVATGDPLVFLRAGGSTFPADALVKVSLIPQLQDSTDPTYYDSAHAHPLDVGHALMAPHVAAALQALGVAPDVYAPTLASATIAANGTTWTLAYSEAVSGHAGFTVAPSGAAVTLTYASGDGTASQVYTGSRTVLSSETATLAYAPGTVADLAPTPNALASFSGFAVANNSAQTGVAFDPQAGVTSATLLTWLRGDGNSQDSAGTTPATATSDPVGRWADLSGNGTHWTTATAGQRPTLQAGPNSHPAVRFDGVDDRLTATPFLSGTTAGEIFLVQKTALYPQTDISKIGWTVFGSAAGATLGFSALGSVNVHDDFGTDHTIEYAPGTDLSAWHAYNARSASGDWTANINGTQAYTTATNTPDWYASPFQIGAASNLSWFFCGDMAEVLVYSGTLSTGDRAAVLAYLQGRYGI